MTQLVLVFAGGGAGSVLRYLIGLLVRSTNIALPLATFCSNMIACLIFALVVYFDRTRESVYPNLSIFLLVGFCGGLSTFSTFGYETYLLLKAEFFASAILNVLFSTMFALALFYFFLRQPN